MTAPKKPIGDLRKELRKAMIDISVRPSMITKREDLEQMIGLYSKFAEEKKNTPLPPRSKVGRKKAREVEAAETDTGIQVPKKLVKEKTDYTVEKKAKKTVAPAKMDADDSGTGSESEEEVKQVKKAVVKVDQAVVEKPKRVLSDEQKAKMKAGREAKKLAAGGGVETPKKAEPKKDEPTPDAPPKDAVAVKKEKRLPVFQLGGN